MSPLAASRSPRIRREFEVIDRAMVRVERCASRFDPAAHDPRDVARVRRRWSAQLRDEHRSTFVFSALAGQMAEAGDPVDVVAVTLRMAQDELRHTLTCAEVVRELGRAAALPVLERVPSLANHAGESPRQRALRNVLLTTCISEMHAVASFVASLDVLRDDFLRARPREVLADEVLHGELGFAYLESKASWLNEGNGRERAAVERYLRFAFAWAERELAFDPSRSEPTEGQRALGLIPNDVAHALYASTMEGAVVPALEALGLSAESAWKRRTIA